MRGGRDTPAHLPHDRNLLSELSLAAVACGGAQARLNAFYRPPGEIEGSRHSLLESIGGRLGKEELPGGLRKLLFDLSAFLMVSL